MQPSMLVNNFLWVLGACMPYPNFGSITVRYLQKTPHSAINVLSIYYVFITFTIHTTNIYLMYTFKSYYNIVDQLLGKAFMP